MRRRDDEHPELEWMRRAHRAFEESVERRAELRGRAEREGQR